MNQSFWWKEGFLRLRENRLAMVCLCFLGFVCVIAVLAPWISPFSFDEQHLGDVLNSPSRVYLFGTDSLGRDLFSRVIYGSRMSMAVGVFAALVSLVIGSVYGAFSGWMGGWVDAWMMRFVDIAFCVPSLVIMILVKVVFDGFSFFEDPELRSLIGTLSALAIVGWMSLARLVRAQVLRVKAMAYMEAGKALGFGSLRLLWFHGVPNILGPVIVMLSSRIPGNILLESFISFIGLGLQPPYSSWGLLASEGVDTLGSFPHLILFPALVLFLTLMAFQILGDGLRDVFDPEVDY